MPGMAEGVCLNQKERGRRMLRPGAGRRTKKDGETVAGDAFFFANGTFDGTYADLAMKFDGVCLGESREREEANVAMVRRCGIPVRVAFVLTTGRRVVEVRGFHNKQRHEYPKKHPCDKNPRLLPAVSCGLPHHSLRNGDTKIGIALSFRNTYSSVFRFNKAFLFSFHILCRSYADNVFERPHKALRVFHFV